MEKRYEGLTQFICTCSTPMTVAIQGDWGSGKTSAMEIIREKIGTYLKDRTDAKSKNFIDKLKTQNDTHNSVNPHCIWFNTWQFSLFDSGENLTLHLIDTMLDSLKDMAKVLDIKDEMANISGFQNVVNTTMRIIGSAVGAGLKNANPLIGLACDTAEGLSRNSSDDSELTQVRSVNIKTLRDDMNRLIDKILEKTGHDRIYVFIDDLDRLEPRVAVEMLEGMKIFANYSKCVFILAIDKSVVTMGLKGKYGDEFIEDENNDKSNSFFDKIIQVPFSLPVSAYNIKEFVTDLRKSDVNIDGYVELLKAFNEYNPRTIKRSFNLLELYRCMNSSDTSDNKSILDQYAILLLQVKSDTKTYNDLITEIRGHYNSSDNGEINSIFEIFRDIYTGKRSIGLPMHAVISQFYGEEMDNAIIAEGEEQLSENVLNITREFAKMLMEMNNAMGNSTEEVPASSRKDACFAEKLYHFLNEECHARMDDDWEAIWDNSNNQQIERHAYIGNMDIKYFSRITKSPYITIRNAAPRKDFLEAHTNDFANVDPNDKTIQWPSDKLCYPNPYRSTITFFIETTDKFEVFREMLLDYPEIKAICSQMT
ncbi:MAG: hypothetical protein IJO91_06500 [Oscillospiraceae bacterium]|nr:hypothetical protein [Oscillospiraceae bacterium]